MLKNGCLTFDNYSLSINGNDMSEVSQCEVTNDYVVDNTLIKRKYVTGDAVSNYGGYNWHVISDDGEYVTLLMDVGENGNYKLPDDPNGNLTHFEPAKVSLMKHCSPGNNNNCTIFENTYLYSWDKSLIQVYLNNTLFNELDNQINNEIIPISICNDSSTNGNVTYGGYLREEVADVSGTCSGYGDYKVRLITASEFVNLSPGYNSIDDAEQLIGQKIANLDYKISKLDNSSTEWLYSSYRWWIITSSSYYYLLAYTVAPNDGVINIEASADTNLNIRPVITVKK